MLAGTVGTETVLYTWAGSHADRDDRVAVRATATTLFDIVVNQTTGEYTLTLRDNVLHDGRRR